MKLLITTRADNNISDWVELTHPIIRKYADKVKADFLVLDEDLNCDEAKSGIGLGVYQYRIMKHYDLHDEYDRILSFDTDMLLSPNCPSCCCFFVGAFLANPKKSPSGETIL